MPLVGELGVDLRAGLLLVLFTGHVGVFLVLLAAHVHAELLLDGVDAWGWMLVLCWTEM
jgi:hypothetical protein